MMRALTYCKDSSLIIFELSISLRGIDDQDWMIQDVTADFVSLPNIILDIASFLKPNDASSRDAFDTIIALEVAE